MSALWQLLRKDLLSQRWAMGVLLFLTFTWHIFLYSRVGVWPREVTLALGLIPFFFTQLWVLWISFQTYRTEWSEDTAYFLLSAPISSWLITGVKLLTVVLYTLFGVGTILASYLLFLRADLATVWDTAAVYLSSGWYKRDLMNGGLLLFLTLVSSVMLMHFAYICSRMANRFRGLVVIWVLVVSQWLCGRIAALIEPILRWLPSFSIDIPMIESFNYVAIHEIKISSAIFGGYVLAVFGLFALANWLWEKHIEIV